MKDFAFIAVAGIISTTSASPLTSLPHLGLRDNVIGNAECAQPGELSGRASIWSSTDGTYPQCSAECFARPECQSFGYYVGDCQLFDSPVYDHMTWASRGRYQFYDVGCEKENMICAFQALSYGVDSYWYSNTISLSACVAECNEQSTVCKSYAYGNGECNLFDVPASGNIDSDTNSPYLFYDHTCPSPANSSSTTTATTTTTAKTSSKTSQMHPTTTASTSKKSSATSTTSRTTSMSTAAVTSTSVQKSSTTTLKPSTTTTTTTTRTATTTTTKPSTTVTTTSTRTSTSTTAVISTDPGTYELSDSYCALKGYDTKVESFDGNTDGTYPGCSAACFANPECKSFSYKPGECNLYNVPVRGNGDENFDSPYYFYDTACEQEYVQCGVQGGQWTFDDYWYSNTGTLSDCAAECARQSDTCKSYLYGNGECSLYDVPVSGNLYSKRNGHYFYDHKCPLPSGSSTSSSSTKTSIVSSTTSTTKSSLKSSATTAKASTTSKTTTTGFKPTTTTTTKKGSASITTTSSPKTTTTKK